MENLRFGSDLLLLTRTSEGDQRPSPPPAAHPPEKRGLLAMIKVEDFRAGLHGVPHSCVDEIPDCCFRCSFLVYQEAACALPYYFCGYNLPDRINQDTPKCSENQK